MRRSAFNALGRGLSNLLANWPLLGLYLVVATAVGVVTVLGLVAPLLVLDLELSPELAADPGALALWLEEAFQRTVANPLPTAAALLGSTLLWTLAFVLQCFGQAGIFGVLYAGDVQAPDGLSGPPTWFRTFGFRDFLGWGARHVWRFFWLGILYFHAWLGLVLAWGLLAMLAAWGFERWGGSAALGIGCGGSLPLLFVSLVLVASYGLASADAVRESSGVWRAVRVGLTTLGRRLAANAVLYGLFTMLLLLLAGMMWGASATAEVVLAGHRGLARGADLALELAQALAQGALMVWLGASLVALVRGEAVGGGG